MIVLAFLAIYVIWGSTYLFVAFGLEQIPPFRYCALRYSIAGVLCFLIYYLFYPAKEYHKKELINSAKAGLIFLGLGTGGVAWALKYIDTGVAALIVASSPLIIVMFMWLLEKKRPGVQTMTGIGIGMLGMYLLVGQEEIMVTTQHWIGLIIILLSVSCWSLGAIFVSKAQLPSSQWVNSGTQMIVGGIFTLLISLLLRESGEPMQNYSILTWSSLAILVFFGSIIAFTSFNFLLKNVSPEKVATNTYVNPIIAIILGFYFRDEIITTRSIIAAAILLTGVFIVNTNRAKLRNRITRSYNKRIKKPA